MPDGSFSRVEFSPWHVRSFDPNDTAFDSDSPERSDWYERRMNPANPRFVAFNTPENVRAAKEIETHGNTPSLTILDSLGREVIAIAHNRLKDTTGAMKDEKYLTFTKLDAEGKPLWIRDARKNLVMQYINPPKANNDPSDTLSITSAPCYDIAGNLLFSRYSYDALYRLIEASGRESVTTLGPPSQTMASEQVDFPIVIPGALRKYTQQYTYDAVGNFKRIQHVAESSGSWTRDYAYAFEDITKPASNRLWQTWTGGDRINAVTYRYDSHGNMLNAANIAPAKSIRWDYRDMIHFLDLEGGGLAFYNYGADKQRTRKRLEKDGTVEERIDLGGLEIYRKFRNGTLVEEIESVHVMEGQQRVLLIDDVLQTDKAKLKTGALYRYQYSNHLGSAALELDDKAQIISYEEFHPYGTTAYCAGRSAAEVSLKRYRYTGKERDEETGFGYYGVRYYVPHLGRWTAVDPLGIKNGVSLYVYVQNAPTNLIDPNGAEDTPPAKPLGLGDHIRVGLIVAGAMLSIEFMSVTHETPEQFGKDMLDKGEQILVTPIVTLYGPNGMFAKAGEKLADRASGLPDKDYVTKEEHDRQLSAIISVGGSLFPGFASGVPSALGPALVTSEGITFAPAAAATRLAVPVGAGAIAIAASTGGGGGKPKPKGLGKKPGEPGEWLDDLAGGENMSNDAARYQEQITKRPANQTYYVNGRSFDGFEPGKGGQRGTLLEAKHLGDEGRFAKAFENMKKGNFSDLKHLIDRGENILEQAKAQVRAAEGTGARIEWRVSGQRAEEALNMLFENDPELKGRITVGYEEFVK